MRMKRVGTVVLVVALCAVTVLVIVKRHGEREAQMTPPPHGPNASPSTTSSQPASLPASPPQKEEMAQHALKPGEEPSPALDAAPSSRTNLAVKIPARPDPPATKTDPPPTDELARTALSFVGMDPDAEEYWISAINDPNLQREERKNLIEDLNEDGLSDPQHPTSVDLPLILSRLELIEQLAPDAMDEANADAFQEAYKDLLNLAELAVGRGHPVQ